MNGLAHISCFEMIAFRQLGRGFPAKTQSQQILFHPIGDENVCVALFGGISV